jgi:hypothetical protein
MNLAGFYEELGAGSDFSQGSIREVRLNDAQPDEDLLAAYLDQGHLLVDFTETTRDVIGGKERIIGGSSLRSDNTWIWRIDLSFYVRKYHLKLPDEFVEHARSQGFTVPEKNPEMLIARARSFFQR